MFILTKKLKLDKKLEHLIDVRKKHLKKKGGKRGWKKRNVDLTVPRVFFYEDHFCDSGPTDRHKESVSRLKIHGARRQVDVERS